MHTSCRLPVRLAALLVACLGLASCASTGDGAAGTGPGRSVVVATELPLQGAGRETSEAVNNAIRLYLTRQGDKAGPHGVTLQQYDDSSPVTQRWDETACRNNAEDHLRAAAEVAVIGPADSGCAQLMLPVLSADGPLVVSHASAAPGLTRAAGPGEPQKYFPSGRRGFARVVTPDDVQGAAAARFAAQKLGAGSVWVLDDGQVPGRAVAQAFAREARQLGVEVAGTATWGRRGGHKDLLERVRAARVDLVYLGGTYDAAAEQLLRDKAEVLGDNTSVEVMASDGFSGQRDLQASPVADGLYVTFPGLVLDQIRQGGGFAAEFLEEYRARYGAYPATSRPLYGVAAAQVVLAALARSDGTRRGVRDQVLGGEGVTIPADRSATGQEIRVDPATGDVTSRDVSVLVLEGGRETFVQLQPIG